MGGCVLIVEDDVPMARAIRRMVELLTDGEGVVAPSCAVARELLASLHTWRGAIIDKCLPDGDGLDVLAELRCLHRELPALVLTGVCSHEVAERARALGARYVVKPPLAEEVSDIRESHGAAGDCPIRNVAQGSRRSAGKPLRAGAAGP